ncbi:MAG: outer membrane protein assembly factor [Planctomycetes bacterium]|nr:outer membrane protein assembly factor [Planctomycetota bacterium]
MGNGGQARRRLTALAAFVLAAGALAQEQPRPTIGSELYLADEVKALVGRRVRSIRIVKAGTGGGPTTPLDSTSAEPIVRGLQTRVGQGFEPRHVSADCQSLWSERRLITTCYVQPVDDEVIVTYQVDLEVEVYDEVEFEGLGHLDKPTVDGLLGLYPDRQTTRPEAEAMRKVLLARYRRDGFAFCSIELRDLPSIGLGDGSLGGPRPRLRVLIDEGPKVRVRDLHFLGDHSFAADAVLGRFGSSDYLIRDAEIASDPARLFDWIAGGPFSRETIEEDLDRLRLFYRRRGFLEATVDLTDAVFSQDRAAVDLSFVIVEGPRYRIRSLRVEHVNADQSPLFGEPLYSAEEVAEVVKSQAGSFYDNDQLQRDAQAIEDFYGRRGHPSVNFPGMRAAPGQGCSVFPPLEIYGDGPEVDVVFRVSEGTPKYLRDVVIRGNRFTRDRVIRRNFRVLPGDRIDMLEVRRALQRIEQTRFFQDPVSLRGPRLQIEPVPGEADQVDLGLDVEDGPTGELRWGVGISSGIGAQGQISFNKRNFDLAATPSSANPITAIGEILDQKAFHGGGQDLKMLLAPGTRYSQFAVTFIEPDLFRQYFETYQLNVSGQRQIRRLRVGYTSDVIGGEVGLSRYLTEHFNVGVALRHETVKVDSLALDATQLAFDAQGTNELRSTRLSMRYRDYDDYMRPTSGLDASLNFEMIGGFLGGDESMTKWTHQFDAYVPLLENEHGHRTVFHYDHFFGLGEAFGNSNDVFLTERFFMGGANLRGFQFFGAGPTQFNRPLGGEATFTATTEVYFPLISTRMEGDIRERELLRWVLFTDFGLLGLGLHDPTFQQLRASSGVGLRIEIPYLQVPIAIDLGWPWLYEETDDRRQLYFSISR